MLESGRPYPVLSNCQKCETETHGGKKEWCFRSSGHADEILSDESCNNGDTGVGSRHHAENTAECSIRLFQHQLVELGHEPAFKDTPKQGSGDAAKNATQEENMNVVAQEGERGERIDNAVSKTCCSTAMSICEGAGK